MAWYVYILKCNDNSLYVGSSSNPDRRLIEHNNNDRYGSKYVRVRRPAKLVYTEILPNRSTALKRELAIKGWNRKKKLELTERFVEGLASSEKRSQS